MTTYTCPMHPEIRQEIKGRCPKCGMELVPQEEVKEHMLINSEPNKSYTPLIVIIALILLTTFTLALRDLMADSFAISKTISYFMIGFFLTFAGFKLIDLRGFAEGYSTYDLLAKKWFAYGYIYPFIELIFGLLMILNVFPKTILIVEFVVMTFSGLGVAIKLARKEKFQCACLGTFLKIPLTKVTLIEDFGMALLALIILVVEG